MTEQTIGAAAVSRDPGTPPRVNGRALVTTYYAAFTALGLFSGALGPTLPGLAEQTRSTLGQISNIIMAHGLGYIIGSLVAGRVYDRTAGHRVMAISLVVMSAALFLVPVLPQLWLLAAVILIMAVAEGFLDVGGNALLVWAFREKVAPAMQGLHLFFGVGALIAPIIVAQVIMLESGIRWTYWLLAPLMWPAIVMLSRLRSPEPPPVEDTITGRVDYRTVALIALFQFFSVGAEGAFFNWIFTYGIMAGQLSKTMGAYLTSTFWIAFTLSRLVGVAVSTRWTPSRMVLTYLPLAMAGLALILLLPPLGPALWIGTFMVGAGIGPLFASIFALTERVTRVTGQVTGIIFVGGSLGMMCLPWIIGQLIEPVGPQAIILCVLASLSLALATVAVILVRRRRAAG
jgi:MFS transporter, FHS family, Na+ dependent glucose transporter 1